MLYITKIVLSLFILLFLQFSSVYTSNLQIKVSSFNYAGCSANANSAYGLSRKMSGEWVMTVKICSRQKYKVASQDVLLPYEALGFEYILLCMVANPNDIYIVTTDFNTVLKEYYQLPNQTSAFRQHTIKEPLANLKLEQEKKSRRLLSSSRVQVNIILKNTCYSATFIYSSRKVISLIPNYMFYHKYFIALPQQANVSYYIILVLPVTANKYLMLNEAPVRTKWYNVSGYTELWIHGEVSLELMHNFIIAAERFGCYVLGVSIKGSFMHNAGFSTDKIQMPEPSTTPNPLNTTTNVTTTDVTATNVTATNVTATDVTAKNVTTTNVTATNVTATDVTAKNVTGTNVTAKNVTATNVTATNLTATEIFLNATLKTKEEEEETTTIKRKKTNPKRTQQTKATSTTETTTTTKKNKIVFTTVQQYNRTRALTTHNVEIDNSKNLLTFLLFGGFVLFIVGLVALNVYRRWLNKKHLKVDHEDEDVGVESKSVVESPEIDEEYIERKKQKRTNIKENDNLSLAPIHVKMLPSVSSLDSSDSSLDNPEDAIPVEGKAVEEKEHKQKVPPIKATSVEKLGADIEDSDKSFEELREEDSEHWL